MQVVCTMLHAATETAPPASGPELPPPLPGDEATAMEDPALALPDARLWQTPEEPEGSQPVRPVILETRAQPVAAAGSGNQSPLFRLTRDPLARTSLNQAMGGGELLADGLSGVPGNLSSPLLPPPRADSAALVFGPFRVGATVGVNTMWQQIDLDGGEKFDETAVSLAASLNLTMGEPESGRTATLLYSASFRLLPEESGLPAGAQFRGAESSTNNRNGRLNQDLSLRAQYHFSKLELGLGLNFTSLSGQNRDLGGEAERDLLSISLTSRYPLSPKTSVSWDLVVPIREFQGAIGSRGLTTQHFVDYQYSPKTSVGVGGSYGWLNVEGGASQSFQQATVRVAYEVSAKVQATATMGYEFRQTGDRITNTPVFTLGSTWTPREGTTVSLAADRRIFNSAAEQNVNFTSTSVMLKLTQRVGVRYRAALGLGWESSTYESASGALFANREDELLMAQASLAMEVNKRLTCSVNVGFTHNDSNYLAYRTLTAGVQGSLTF